MSFNHKEKCPSPLRAGDDGMLCQPLQLLLPPVLLRLPRHRFLLRVPRSRPRLQAPLRLLRGESALLRGADGRGGEPLRAAAGGLHGAAVLYRVFARVAGSDAAAAAQAGSQPLEA
jgi:hypothetical protein